MNLVSKFPKNIKRQFQARIRFHFREHQDAERRRWFLFSEDGHRRVPMQMEGVEGLNTVGMWTDSTGAFRTGDEVIVDCVVLWEDAFRDILVVGSEFELWDSGFFAQGKVIHRYEEGWTENQERPF